MSKLDINHLHLYVRNLERSMEFYESLFGFKAQMKYGDDLIFLKNRHGFDLALDRVENVEKLPRGFHFGVSLQSREELEAIHRDVTEKFASLLEKPSINDRGTWASFVCMDPDGYAIELYWDPALLR